MRPSELLARVTESDSLPSRPGVPLEVLRLSREPSGSAGQLAAVIQQDPALTARILRLVNSPLFGAAREIGSIRQAIGLLGTRSIEMMALSFLLVEQLDDAPSGLDLEACWRRSITTAVTARLLAAEIAPSLGEEAFVAGLLADVGLVAGLRAAPDLLAGVLAAARESRRPLAEIERERLGLTHALLSGALLEKWGLPVRICAAVAASRGESLPGGGQPQPMTRILQAAALIADLFCGELPSVELEAVRERCIDAIPIDSARLDPILQRIDESVRSTAATLSVSVGSTNDYTTLRAHAALRLAELGVQAEAERHASETREAAARAEAERLIAEKQGILRAAAIDGLTQVHNRAAFDQRLERELQAAQAAGRPLALIMIDVDHFKHLNDLYGHQAGDDALRAVAECLRRGLGSEAFCARYGGEEFAVILPSGLPDARRAAEQMRACIGRTRVRCGGGSIKLTASFGVAVCSEGRPPATPRELIEQTDRMLYQAKRGGRNRVEVSALAPAPVLS